MKKISYILIVVVDTQVWKCTKTHQTGADRTSLVVQWLRICCQCKRLPFHFSLSCIGEGNGNPLQCSCLENPRDRGAWRAAVFGVAQSRTRLKWLSSSSSSSQCKGHRIESLVWEDSASLVPQMVKNLPAMQETRAWFLGREDSLGEGNGYSLRYSCLENPMDSLWGHKATKSMCHNYWRLYSRAPAQQQEKPPPDKLAIYQVNICSCSFPVLFSGNQMGTFRIHVNLEH